MAWDSDSNGGQLDLIHKLRPPAQIRTVNVKKIYIYKKKKKKRRQIRKNQIQTAHLSAKHDAMMQVSTL